MRRFRTRFAAASLLACGLTAASAAVLTPRITLAQGGHVDLGAALLPDGEEARYLRALQTLQRDRTTLASVAAIGDRHEAAWRALGVAQDAQPWAARLRPRPSRRGLTVVRPDLSLIQQGGLITEDPAGVAWAGLGQTVSAQAGVAFAWRWGRAQLAPVAFWSANRPFTLTANGQSGPLQFGDPRFPGSIDLPQRFGDDPYGRLDLGDSFLEVHAMGAAMGLSNARQHWGPAEQYPLVIGTASGGFAHFYLQPRAPLRTRIGQLHGRVILGRLEQSPYSARRTGETARFLSGVVGSYAPAVIPGLELGATRIVNGPWPAGGVGLAELLLPFEGILNDNASNINQNANNGFASVFARFSPPGSGVDAHLEMSREDFAGNLRWLMLEPDDLVHLTLGVSRAVRRADGGLQKVFLELTNGDVAHTERAARTLATPFPPYIHLPTLQGLTNRGQLLGSRATYGGAGATIGIEQFTARGRRRLAAERVTVLDWLPALGASGGVSAAEVRYGLRWESLRFVGDRDVTVYAAPSYTLNHALMAGRDVWALAAGARWRGW